MGGGLAWRVFPRGSNGDFGDTRRMQGVVITLEREARGKGSGEGRGPPPLPHPTMSLTLDYKRLSTLHRVRNQKWGPFGFLTRFYSAYFLIPLRSVVPPLKSPPARGLPLPQIPPPGVREGDWGFGVWGLTSATLSFGGGEGPWGASPSLGSGSHLWCTCISSTINRGIQIRFVFYARQTNTN
jgi:hypothetical protein